MVKMSLKSARVNAGYTQESAAKELNVSKKTIWSWENGKSIPKIDKINPICNLYGLKYDDISWLS